MKYYPIITVQDPNTANLYKKILSGDFAIPKFVSNEARDLLKCILNTDPLKRYTIEDIRKHPWFNIVTPQKDTGGLIIGYNSIPIDRSVLNMLEQYGFNSDYAQKCIDANKHNHVTTTYRIAFHS